MSRCVIIDADSIVYQATMSALNAVEWAPGCWTMDSQMADVLPTFVDQIKQIEEELGADKIVLALGDYDNPCWRLNVMPTYKENRAGGYKPLCFFPLRKEIQKRYDTFIRPTLEGDDCCGILLTKKGFAAPMERVLISLDKDMHTLPGLHVNLLAAQKKGDWTIHKQSPVEADRFHMNQTLQGDTVDGYKGCPGIGKVNAARILAGLSRSEMWNAVVTTYESKGSTEEVALQNARVARILRSSDFSFRKREVRLWTPQELER